MLVGKSTSTSRHHQLVNFLKKESFKVNKSFHTDSLHYFLDDLTCMDYLLTGFMSTLSDTSQGSGVSTLSTGSDYASRNRHSGNSKENAGKI